MPSIALNLHRMTQTKHTITIGMPVMNGSKHVAAALRDFQAQTFQNWELVVCDNASDDDTARIVEEFARTDKRISLKRFETRVNVFHSFIRALQTSRSAFFMFAAADDRHYPRFLERTLGALERHPEIIGACPKVAFLYEGRFTGISEGTGALDGTPQTNINTYLSNPRENSRLFSVFRSEAVSGAWPHAVIPGVDFHTMARILRHGPTLEIDEVLMERDQTGAVSYVRLNDSLTRNVVTRMASNLPVARDIWRDPDIPNSISLARALVRLIWLSVEFRMSMVHPKLHGFFARLWPRVEPYER